MKNLKSTKGFTLVELIVVIAILGILAAVAVPAYSGYLTKANEAADITQLDAIKTAAQAYKAKTGTITTLKVYASNGTISQIAIDGTDVFKTSATHEDDFMLFLANDAAATALPTNMKLSSATYKNGATWTSNTWTAGTT